MSVSTIQQHIRQAAAHEDAAGRHEDKYEQQMKSAGASMYEAFVLALRAAEEFKGRQIDDKAILRIYQSTKPRPWWDEQLKAAKLIAANGKADRERSTRLIQWHVDPNAAQGRRAQHALKEAARRKTLDKQGRGKTHGARVDRKRSQATEAKHSARVTEAAQTAALGGRELPEGDAPAPKMGLDDLLREVNRLSSAVRKVKPEHREEVCSMLVAAARDVERYIT
jgi:hypothetical protein